MANSKKLVGYTGTELMVSVPTAVNSAMVRQIATSTFTSTSVSTVKIDTYANDITGAPWGAQNVVWMKEPICTISFNANGGSGSMPDDYTNIGMAYRIPQCGFSGVSSATFSAWAVNDVSGQTLQPGTQYAFPSSTELYALWNVPEKWFNNDKSTWAEANAEGWNGADYYINGFNKQPDISSTYNIPSKIAGVSITYILDRYYTLRGKSFTEFGGKNITYIQTGCRSNSALLELSFPRCSYIGRQAFDICPNLTSMYFPVCSYIDDYAFKSCSGLTTISFPMCSYVGYEAFSMCSFITTVSMPSLLSFSGRFLWGTSFVTNQLLSSSTARLITSQNNFILGTSEIISGNLKDTSTTYIADQAFTGTRIRLSTVEFTQCKVIGAYCFSDCSITSASFPACQCILNSAFYRCTELTSINFTACKFISAAAFERCYGISKFDFPQCSYISNNAFQLCDAASQFSLPKCEYIGDTAFRSCSALTTISLPVCSRIGGYAFWQCTSLQDCYILSTSVATLAGTGAFSSCTSLSKIYVPLSLVDSYKSATNWSYYSSLIDAYRS